MELKARYRQTEVGPLPEGWRVETINRLLEDKSIVGHLDGNHGELYPRSSEFKQHGVPYIGANDFAAGFVTFERCKFLSEDRAAQFRKGVAKDGDVLFAHNATVGPVALLRTTEPFVILSTTATYFRCNEEKLSNIYLKSALQSSHFVKQYQAVMAQSTRFQVPITAQRKFSLVVPPVLEQRAIATALGDVDGLLNSLTQLIAKKRDLKEAVMQQLLTCRRRLPGFSGGWELRTLRESTDSRDNVRVPLNEAQRAEMKGDYPYGGANGVLDYINAYVIDDDIILIAEDGGYFDEYEHRPIAYRMSGKCWVNNHAHILKAKEGYDQGFIFYSLVHKNILSFLASGTRAKLNKSEMWKIEVDVPMALPEQAAIAEVLSDMDAEIAVLEQRRDKTRALKQGMMQELLTGRTRLV